MPHKVKFIGSINTSSQGLWINKLLVPDYIALNLKEKGLHRFICQVKAESWSCSVLQSNGIFFIMLNQKRIKAFDLKDNEPIEVTLTEDKSIYGMDIPTTLSSMFNESPEAFNLFEKLSPGKQRTLIYLVAKVKSENSQQKKSKAIMHHLIEAEGKVDFKRLNELIKEYNQNLY